jgi:hypothetical protein
MAKKEAQVIESTEVGTVEEVLGTEVVETVATPKAVKQVRILPMDDGSNVNFGARANLISTIDVDNLVISFKIALDPIGKVITWALGEVVNTDAEGNVTGKPFEAVATFPENFKKIFLYGLMERVKSSLAPVKLADLPTAIAKQIEAINKGDFIIRSVEGEDGEVALTKLQKAYATVKSNPLYVTVAKPEWANVDDAATIADVLNFWEGLSASDKNNIRKNPYVKLEQAKLEVGTGEVEEASAI